jgi:hypothetical protein
MPETHRCTTIAASLLASAPATKDQALLRSRLEFSRDMPANFGGKVVLELMLQRV